MDWLLVTFSSLAVILLWAGVCGEGGGADCFALIVI